MDTGPDSLKTTSKKVVYKTGEFLGNFENKILKTKPVEKIIILLEKREEILNELRQVL